MVKYYFNSITLFVFLLIFLFTKLAFTQREVYMKVQAEGFQPILISVPPFIVEQPNKLASTMREVLINDLDLSGFFRIFEKELINLSQYQLTMQEADSVLFKGVSARLEGRVEFSRNQIKFDAGLFELPSNKSIFKKRFTSPLRSFRQLSHRIADEVTYYLTGEKGVASTKIAFITSNDNIKEIAVIDFDGHNFQKLTFTQSLNLSPSWSPDGNRLIFMSYVEKYPYLFMLNLNSGKLQRLLKISGLQIAPAWSPDGKKIAFSLTQNGNTEIYVLEVKNGKLHRLTNSPAIDSSPTWSPNGREIAFTSDRSGTPQIYIMDSEGSNVRRLTFQGNYNDSPAWSPRGDLIAYVSREEGRFNIYTIEVSGENPRRLTYNAGSNEDPCWSPNGFHLAFASNRGGKWDIYVMQWDGSNVRRLTRMGQNVSPCWSPYLNKN